MKKKKNCKKATSYNCGNSCINEKYVCRKDGLSGQSVSIANRLASVIESIKTTTPASAPAPASTPKPAAEPETQTKFQAPIADNAKRSAKRAAYTEAYFGGDEAKVKAFEEKVSSILKDIPVKITTIGYLADTVILPEGGRLKNQFETGTSGGALNPDLRKEKELEQFGYAADTPAEVRPKYGFVHTKGPELLTTYGDTVYESNKIPLDQYTVTIGDSLENEVFGSRADDFKIESMSELSISHMAQNRSVEAADINDVNDLSIDMYIEAQIGSDVNLNDFEVSSEYNLKELFDFDAPEDFD